MEGEHWDFRSDDGPFQNSDTPLEGCVITVHVRNCPLSDYPQVWHISFLCKQVSDGTFPISGCPFREPGVSEIAHVTV